MHTQALSDGDQSGNRFSLTLRLAFPIGVSMAYHSGVGERTDGRPERGTETSRSARLGRGGDGPRDGNGIAAPGSVVAAGPKKRLANHDATLPRP